MDGEQRGQVHENLGVSLRFDSRHFKKCSFRGVVGMKAQWEWAEEGL